MTNIKLKLAMIYSNLNLHKRDRNELMAQKINSRLDKNLELYGHELDVLLNSLDDNKRMKVLSGHAGL